VNKSLDKLQRQLGYQFKDTTLATLALTHRSYSEKNNERLEYLGDSILNFTIAEALYKKFHRAKEGELSRSRSSLVKGATLAEIAREMKLGDYLYLGIGERKSGGHKRASILADVVEALIGAIYLDSDISSCQKRILCWFDARINTISIDANQNKDPKTRLQEWLQSQKLPLPDYELIEISGQAHNQTFRVRCHIESFKPVTGVSHSRRGAEQNAAQQILIAASSEENK